MTNTDEETKVVKNKIAEHALIDASGNVVDEEELATGIRYKLVALPDPFDFQIPNATPGAPETMLAIFGAKTLATNETSAARNGKAGADWGAQLDAVKDRFDLIMSGKWLDRTRDGVGARVDKDALAGAVVDVATAAGKSPQYDVIRQKLEEDATFMRTVRAVPEIAAAYAKRVGKVKTLDDVIGSLGV